MKPLSPFLLFPSTVSPPRFFQRSRGWLLLAALSLSACANMAAYSGSGLRVHSSTQADVESAMGAPAMRWNNEDGNIQLAYPRGPMGYHTFMAYIGPDGKLRRIENVMDPVAFARIQKGMTKEQVLHVLGPPQPQWTVYFKARDELVWEWRFCNDWNQPARFDVLFDGTNGTVRTTQQWEEALHDPWAPKFCSRTLAQPLPTDAEPAAK